MVAIITSNAFCQQGIYSQIMELAPGSTHGQINELAEEVNKSGKGWITTFYPMSILDGFRLVHDKADNMNSVFQTGIIVNDLVCHLLELLDKYFA